MFSDCFSATGRVTNDLQHMHLCLLFVSSSCIKSAFRKSVEEDAFESEMRAVIVQKAVSGLVGHGPSHLPLSRAIIPRPAN